MLAMIAYFYKHLNEMSSTQSTEIAATFRKDTWNY